MNKLRLHLEELAVESFDTAPAERKKGTVFGEQCTCQTVCTCPGCPTCDYTCPNTCDDASCFGATCEGTCWPQCGPSQWETCPAICPRLPY
ncbi:MAG TPA: hypothetical protein VFR37_01115 [Longimicrobium sp.]|nr:hypothetical protein [Longimicrobium sp.]